MKKKDVFLEVNLVILAQIDWNDFVVVETIDIRDDEEIPLANQFATHFNEGPTDEEMEIETNQRLANKLFGVERLPEIKEIQTQPESNAKNLFIASIQENVQVKDNYVPKIQGKEDSLMKCQNCNRYIPSSEMNEHLRIELLDPKFQEMKIELKQRELNSIRSTGAEMTKNLESFKSKRPDIFGITDDLITNEATEEKISNKHFLSKETLDSSNFPKPIEKKIESKGNPEKKVKGDSYFQGTTLSQVPMPNLENANNPFQPGHSVAPPTEEKPQHHLMPEEQYKLICPVSYLFLI